MNLALFQKEKVYEHTHEVIHLSAHALIPSLKPFGLISTFAQIGILNLS